MEYHGFLDDLEETVKNYTGRYEKMVKYLPKLFNLLCDILYDSKSGWNTKLIVASSLGYFVLPEDVIRDSEEEIGYLDDLYLVTFVLKQIEISPDKDLIKDNWKEEEDIYSLIEEIYQTTKDYLGGICEDILSSVGLRKYISMEFEYSMVNHSSKIKKIMDEKIELLGLLSFMTAKLYGVSRSRVLEDVKELIQKHEDYSEIERIITLAREKSISKTINDLPLETFSIERKLRRKRIKSLLKEKNDIE